MLLFAALLPLLARAQSDTARFRATEYTETLAVTDTLRLARQFVELGSVSIGTENGTILPDSGCFSLDLRLGIVVLTARGRGIVDSLHTTRLRVTYRALPFRFPPVYRARELVLRTDTARGDTLRVFAPSAPLTMENIFGAGLQKSGYIGRGFTVGTNRDLTLNSGFRLSLAGKLAEDIDIMAALTDENTPIQPEGNTRTIQELDKVFIRISSGPLAATLGDFSLSFSGTEFGSYNRKLSGVLAEGSSPLGSAAASYATMKGSYRTVQFAGIDGVQGPYRLTGKNGEQRIVVLAGTERVYVDGVEMTRGETFDYIIEYASGEITFRPRRLITAASRITVDFEYADRQYARALFAANATADIIPKALAVTARYMREGDDPDSPIDFELSAEDRRVLADAGDDPRKAATSGVVYAGIDTARGNGAGQYVRIDTTIGGAPMAVYRYAPGDDSATYTVTFSYVGTGSGDYSRKTLGSFAFVGVGQGDYAPLRLVPVPQLHQTGNLLLAATPFEGLTVRAEGAVSDLARNRLSEVDAADNAGSAVNTSGVWTFGTPVGDVEVAGRFRATASTFAPIDRINDIEFSRRWDVAATTSATETIREGSFALKPASFARASVGAGSYTRGDFSSRRIETQLTLSESAAEAWIPQLSWRGEHITSDDRAARGSGTWLRQRGEARYTKGFIQPTLRFESEDRSASAADTLLPVSLSFVDVRPGFILPAIGAMSFAAEIGYRSDNAWQRGSVVKQSDDIYQQYTLTLRPWNDLSANAAVTLRDRRFSESFRSAGNSDLQTILTKTQIQYTPFNRALAADVLYEVSTEKTSKLERAFLKVPFGQGNYVYKGDVNKNGVEDESEFEPTRFDGDYVAITVPTDRLFPVIDLRSSVRLQVRPARVLGRDGGGLLAALGRALSSETSARIEEKNSTANTADVYLLRLARFLNDTLTLRGFQNLRQDFFLFEQNSELSLRFRYEQNRGFSQFALANERSFRAERSLRLRTQPVREIGVQADLAFTNDNVSTTQASNRARALDAVVFTADFSYRPAARVEVGFVLGAKDARDRYPGQETEASINTQALRTTVTFDGPGRLRIEAERGEVLFSSAVARFPFELTDGKAEGKNWVLRSNFDYRITAFLQATLSYLGRSEGGGTFVHTARAEVRAFF